MMKSIVLSENELWKIIEGGILQARILIDPQPIKTKDGFWEHGGAGWSDDIDIFTPVPCHSFYENMPYKPSEIIYAKEPWCDYPDKSGHNYFYLYSKEKSGGFFPKWNSLDQMPQEAARLFIQPIEVRIGRLQNMSGADLVSLGLCSKEAIKNGYAGLVKYEYSVRWNTSHPKGTGWQSNPWVYIYTFEKTEKPEGTLWEQ